MDNRKWSLGIISLAFLFNVFIASSSADEFIIQQVTETRVKEYNSSYNLEANLGVTRELRDEKPSSKIVTITSFSVIKLRPEPYESSLFEAGGYTWRLVLYVNGNPKDSGHGYISLYLRIEETGSLPSGWEVNVDLKLFVYNSKQNKYLAVTDGAVKRYNNEKKEWGFGQLIDRSTFFNTDQGYTVGDIGSFGAEIFIVKPAQEQEKVTIISNPPNNVYNRKITQFSTRVDTTHRLSPFLVEDRYLGIEYNPKGDHVTNDALKVYLVAGWFKTNAVQASTYVALYVRLKNQINSNHKQKYMEIWFDPKGFFPVRVYNLISFSEFYNPSKGYLVNDAFIFEVEVVKISVTNIVSA